MGSLPAMTAKSTPGPSQEEKVKTEPNTYKILKQPDVFLSELQISYILFFCVDRPALWLLKIRMPSFKVKIKALTPYNPLAKICPPPQ